MVFGRDPGKTVAKARRLLADGDALAALRMARKAQERARPPLSAELAELVEQARESVVREAMERAEVSVAEGLIDDAVEWLLGALDQAVEGDLRTEVQERLTALRHGAGELADVGLPAERDAGEQAAEEPAAAGPSAAGDASGEAGGAVAADPQAIDHLYELYVGTLRPDLQPLYAERPPAFRRALVALNEGDHHGEPVAALLAMAEEAPDDPVLRLERARLHLARGDDEEALPDLAAAAEGLGDEPLDGETWALSIAALWCVAAQELGDHAGVLERLESLGEITLRDPALTTLYADALVDSGETDEAARFLDESVSAFPGNSHLALRLAQLERVRGNAETALEVLEGSFRRACAACGHSRPDVEPEFLRLLAVLYLERGGPLERAGDVLRMLEAARGGELGPDDWRLAARFHELRGEPDRAAAARERAEQGAEQGAERSAAAGMPPAPADS